MCVDIDCFLSFLLFAFFSLASFILYPIHFTCIGHFLCFCFLYVQPWHTYLLLVITFLFFCYPGSKPRKKIVWEHEKHEFVFQRDSINALCFFFILVFFYYIAWKTCVSYQISQCNCLNLFKFIWINLTCHILFFLCTKKQSTLISPQIYKRTQNKNYESSTTSTTYCQK